MAIQELILGNGDLKAFLEAAVDYIGSLDPKTGRPETGNKEAKQGLNSCTSVIGILPFDSDIPYNISRIEKIMDYLEPRIGDNPSLYDLLDKARTGLKLHREQSSGPHTIPSTGLGSGKVNVQLTSKAVLKGKYLDFRDIYNHAVESARSRLEGEVGPEVFEDRMNRMQNQIEDEFTGGMDGLKNHFDAKYSELFYASQKKPAEEQGDFLFRAAKIFTEAFASNNFYELYHKRIYLTASEDIDSFVFRMAKNYTDIKAINPDAVIITYQDGAGDIRLKKKEST